MKSPVQAGAYCLFTKQQFNITLPSTPTSFK